jgi:hypothetical protein
MSIHLSFLNHLREKHFACFLFFGVWFRTESREATVFISFIYYQLTILSARVVCGVAHIAYHLACVLCDADVAAFCEVLTIVQRYHVALAFDVEMVAVDLLLANAHCVTQWLCKFKLFKLNYAKG